MRQGFDDDDDYDNKFDKNKTSTDSSITTTTTTSSSTNAVITSPPTLITSPTPNKRLNVKEHHQLIKQNSGANGDEIFFFHWPNPLLD